MAFHYSPKIGTDGLALYLDAANTKSYVSGSTTWSDLSRSGNNGTLVNGPTFNSESGGSLFFDGTNDYVNGSCTLDGQNITINLWCYPTTSGVFRTPITNQISDGVMIGYAIQQRNDSTFWMTIGTWGVSGDRVINIPYSINQWINLSMTYNGTTITAYRNGILFGTTPSTRIFTSGNLIIGAGHSGLIEYFSGNISQTSIYNRVLTPQEILQNYNATKGRFGL
tara:strand:+ start:81 stop:752 length:672 start_codon:yes stop_codon:yes gene_type:complete